MDNLTVILKYTPVLLDSLRLALYCTILCLLIGYPAAYFMASKDMSRHKALTVLVLVPMWMNSAPHVRDDDADGKQRRDQHDS